jgi:hypothetical protein
MNGNDTGPPQVLNLAKYAENAAQARHHEAMRQSTTSMVAQTTGVMLGLIGFKEGTWRGNPVGLIIAGFVVVLGLWGLTSAVYSESRIQRHRARLIEAKKALDPKFVPDFPTRHTQWIWYAFHTVIILLGLLMALILYSRS